MGSEYGYKFTEKAAADLDGIISYIAVELVNPKAASDFADELTEKINGARAFPDIGSSVINEFLPVDNVKKLIVGNYVVFYLPDEEQHLIHILRIIYGRRNMDEILKELDI